MWRTDRPNYTDLHPNGNFDQVLQHVDVHVSSGNPGAVGVRHRAAQHSMVDNVTVVLDGTVGVGVQSLPGSGGCTKSLTVVGGHIGLDLRTTQPTTPVVGLTLVGQTCTGVLYSGQQTLVLVAANITVASSASAAVVVPSGDAMCGSVQLPVNPGTRPGPQRSVGQVVIVDSVVSRLGGNYGGGSGRANAVNVQARGCAHVTSDTSVLLRNVWLAGCDVAINFSSPTAGRVAADSVRLPDHAGWTHVDTVAVGIEPSPTTPSDQPGINRTLQYQSPIYNPMRMDTDRVVNLTSVSTEPPAAMMAWHSSLADEAASSFRNTASVLVTQYGAQGDGITDDTAAFERAIAAAVARGCAYVGCTVVVGVPAGTFLLSRTLELPNDVPMTLAGVSLRQAVLTTPVADSDFAGPIIRTGRAACVLRDLYLRYFKHQRAAFGVEWQSLNRSSAMVQVRVSRGCAAWASKDSDYCVPFQVNTTQPAVVWRGSGAIYSLTAADKSFKWSSVNSSHTDVSPSYRMLLIDGGVDTRCYACDPEFVHADLLVDAAMEVRGSSGVRFYGVKSEGCNTVLWVNNSHDIAVYGHGGMATPLPFSSVMPSEFLRFPPSLYRVTHSQGVELAMLVDRPVDPDTIPPPWSDPIGWVVVYWEACESGTPNHTLALDRPVLFRIP